MEKYRPKETSTSGTNSNTDHSAYSDIKIDTSTLKDHPNVTMPTQMKDKSKEDQKIIGILMGDEVAPRREFITSNALDVANLDI